MSSASGHQLRFLCPRVPPVNGQLPVLLSSVFASMSLLLSCACILRVVLEREAARGANGDQGSSVDVDMRNSARLRRVFRHLDNLGDDEHTLWRHLLLDRNAAPLASPLSSPWWSSAIRSNCIA